MNITATHINYYHLCHRKLWLFSNGIQMEHTSGTVYEGKLIHESSYPQRAEKYTELAMEGIKIDYYDALRKVVHEVKKSDKMEQAHIAQVKYYLYVLERNGIEGATGVLEYPKLRQTEEVFLTDEDRTQIPLWEQQIQQIVEDENCPEVINKKICKSCSYYEFCYVGE
jgi:CRISPR-associated exonuclease Cas4